MTAATTIDTPRLRLRDLRESDAPAIFDYTSDPEVARHMVWNAATSPDVTLAYVRDQTKGAAEGRLRTWGITWRAPEEIDLGQCPAELPPPPPDAAPDTVIGTITFVKLTPEHGRGEVGYTVGRANWGRGVATEALRAVIDYGFAAMRLHRIEAFHILPNAASGRVMEKAGMRYEGIFRGYLNIKGTFHDAKIYALLRPDWEAARGAAA